MVKKKLPIILSSLFTYRSKIVLSIFIYYFIKIRSPIRSLVDAYWPQFKCRFNNYFNQLGRGILVLQSDPMIVGHQKPYLISRKAAALYLFSATDPTAAGSPFTSSSTTDRIHRIISCNKAKVLCRVEFCCQVIYCILVVGALFFPSILEHIGCSSPLPNIDNSIIGLNASISVVGLLPWES